MDESILITIKKLLGLPEEDESFDTDLIIDINSSVDILRQLGVNVPDGFYVDDDSTTWNELLPSSVYLNMVKTYLTLKVKKWFDPPQNGTTMEALNSSIAELEWRINVQVDPSMQ